MGDYGYRKSGSPHIGAVWWAEVDQEAHYVDAANEFWGLAFGILADGRPTATLIGPRCRGVARQTGPGRSRGRHRGGQERRDRAPGPAVDPPSGAVVRGAGLRYGVSDIVVEADVTDWSLAQIVLCAESMLRGSDAGCGWSAWTDRRGTRSPTTPPCTGVCRRRREVLRRCRHRVRLRGPVVLTAGTLADIVDDDAATGVVELTLTRVLGRAALHGRPAPAPRGPRPERVRPIPDDTLVERWRRQSGAARACDGR